MNVRSLLCTRAIPHPSVALIQVSRRSVSWAHHYFLKLFINDLPDSVSSQLAMYADDSTMYTAYPGPLSATSCASTVLNLDLESVINWGNDWLVTFNQRRLNCYLYPGPDPHIFLPWQLIQYHCRSSLTSDCLVLISPPTSPGTSTFVVLPKGPRSA